MNLEEALAVGQGIERPITCPSPEHEDRRASASVNVLKGLWVCYACGRGGRVDNDKPPSAELLKTMLMPETMARTYTEGYLSLFTTDTEYWRTRFSDDVIVHERLGTDPFTRDATFPVRFSDGRLAGVGRRLVVPEEGARYKYPVGWSASRTFYGWPECFGLAPAKVVVLVEGAADAVALHEIGVCALACYGSGAHLPQRELLARLAPKLVLLGFDADDAGRRAAERTKELLDDAVEVGVIDWGERGDPAATPTEERREAVLETVRGTGYGDLESFRRSASNWRQTLADSHERTDA